MLSKKHFILQKARSEFEKRIEQGEDINFNFSFKENALEEDACILAHKKRKLSKYTGSDLLSGTATMANVQLEEEPELITYDEFFQQYKMQAGESQVKPTTISPNMSPTIELLPRSASPTTTTTTTLITQTSTRKRGSKKASPAAATTVTTSGTATSQGAQNECCLIGCHNSVTNRLRFSLRCHKNEDFKQDFLENGWNKVCHYHYFSDLYKYKKMTHGTAKNSGTSTGRKKSASPVPESSPTLGKRARKTFEEQPIVEAHAQVDQRIEDANVFVHFLMTTKQGGDM